MSDYLSNLAARSLNGTAVMQPRLTSLFESLPEAGRLIVGALPYGDASNAEVDDALGGDEITRDELSLRQAPARGFSDSARQGLSAHEEPATPDALGSVESRREQPSRWLAPGWVQPPSPQIQRSTETPVLISQPTAALSSVEKASEQRVPNKPVSTAGTEPLSIRQLRGEPRPFVVPAIVAQPRATSQGITPHAESAARILTEPQMAPESAPTIRVTIGRVDVRAIMPPAAPAQRSAPPAPRLSLDDYLRGRSGTNS